MAEDLRRTPLYEEHIALGARMAPFAGWEMPVQYAGIIEEHRAVRSSAGVFDVCHMAQFRVFGFGAKAFLQGVLTNDLERASEIGTAQYTLMCDEDGGIIDDLIVYHTGDIEYLIIANAANRITDFDWLRGHAPRGTTVACETVAEHSPEDGIVELVDESDRTALIALQGPRALEVLSELAGEGFSPPARFAIREAVLDTVPALVARTGYTGEDGVEVLCHVSQAAALWRALLSFPEVTPCGLGARDTLRLEMGYALYGSDMDRGVDPISAGLGWVVARDKGEYVGREAIERVREAGPVRKLVGLLVEDGIPRPGFAVLREGEEVGKVASGTFSPTLEKGIATAYVPAELSTPGTRLEVAIRKKTAPATVKRPPFVTTSLSA
ncbi:MAG: glycine cleavage system aminomethyltransferase GcvT [Actinomycetota bacterium]|nr:glycine cleavage system aminomethyltransferase GcvT [Actinomycetota bacterium]